MTHIIQQNQSSLDQAIALHLDGGKLLAEPHNGCVNVKLTTSHYRLMQWHEAAVNKPHSNQ